MLWAEHINCSLRGSENPGVGWGDRFTVESLLEDDFQEESSDCYTFSRCRGRVARGLWMGRGGEESGGNGHSFTHSADQTFRLYGVGAEVGNIKHLC